MKKIHKLSFTLLAIICSLLFMHGTITDTYADDSITLTIDTSNISLNLSTTSSTGKFAESTPANISVSTTSTSGYTLSIASSTGSTDLTNTTDNTSKLTSISNNLTNTEFSSSSNTQYNNQWGYKPSQYVTIEGDTPTTHPNTGANAVFKPLPSTNPEILAITDEANQQGTSDSYTISMGARVNNDTKTGSYHSEPFVIMAVANKSTVPCDDTKLCVQFDGNGLTFPETEAQTERVVNNVNYNSVTTQQQMTKYSHTSNIDDAGVASGSYPNNLATKDVITIPGASELSVTITYGTENNWDMLYVFQGEYTDTIGRNMDQASTGWLYKYMGGNNTTTTVTITIPGDTATFGFYSDDSGNYYGYYAVVTGTSIVRDRTLTSGEYATPTGTNAIFHGWSSTATTPGAGLPSSVEYTDESAVKSNMPGDNTETKTLYAVWQQGQAITFTMDSNTSSIAIVDANGTTVDTITASGQTTILAQGDTYTIKPTYVTGYTTNTITKTTGTGTITPNLPNADFTVGAGTATINVTSRTLITFDQAFANAGKTKYNNYYKMQDANSTICSNVDPAELGAIGEVIDTRDNQVYKIGKLKDNKCWMLDNLALDLTNSTVLSGMTVDNTNASNTTLGYLKGTSTGTTSDKYATAKVSNWTQSTYSYSVPWVNLTNKDVTPQGSDPMASTVLAGEWKVGGYYNYCAASAGSYCYGNGTSQGTSSGNATEDICPKGWRMPAGNTTGEYSALANAIYGSTGSTSDATAYANYRTALRLPLTGVFYNGSAYSQGSYGYFWSSTYSNNNSMHYLYLDTSDVTPSGSSNRYAGNSIRCLLSS